MDNKMQLLYSKTSPYSRKVRVVILEKELHEKVDQQLCNPFDDTLALKAINPLGKIPTLITDEGTPLYDSRVICEYLDGFSGVRLIPESGLPRWQVRRWEALADGIVDAAYNVVMEERRPANEQSSDAILRWQAAITRAVDQANVDATQLPSSISLANIALATALGYLDFRLNVLNWRADRTELANWYQNFAQRTSMIETRPE